jgi:hypothetical protein
MALTHRAPPTIQSQAVIGRGTTDRIGKKGRKGSLFVTLRKKTRLLGISQNNGVIRAYRFSSPEGLSYK